MRHHRNMRRTGRPSQSCQRPSAIERLESRTLLAAAPPTLLRDPSMAGAYVELNGQTFFTESATALYATNGTHGGTFPIRSFGRIGNLTNAGGTLYFTTDSGVWTSDGTTSGTMQLLPIYPNSVDAATAYGFTAVGDEVFFYASKPGVGSGLWKTDGTPGGTTFIKQVFAEALTGAGDTLYFIGDGNEAGKELWRSDGTAAGTVMVKDIHPGFHGSMITVAGDGAIAAVGDKLVFKAHDGTSSFFSLWSSDGTAAGTVKISSVRPNYDFTTIGDVVYFGAGSQLWKSDGTAAGTAGVKELGTMSASQLLDADGTLYFAGPDGFRSGSLWKSDGTAAGTVRVAGPAEGKPFENFWDLSNADGMIVFMVSDPAVPSGAYSVWTSDGTTAGTVKVRDTFTGGMQGAPGNLGAFGSVALFTANDGVGAPELWALQTAMPPPVPQAKARGPSPYVVIEGGTLNLHGYTTAEPLPGRPLTYAWDLDDDGIFGETGAAADHGNESGTDPTFNAAALDGPSTHTVRFRISDSTGYTSTDAADVTVRNLPPALNVSGGPAVLTEGNPYTLTLSSDGGPDTINQWIIDWGDGVTQTLPGSTTSVTHDYPPGPATYGITVKAQDDDGEFQFDRAAAFDADFGAGGVVTSDVVERDDMPRNLAVQRDGKIVTVSTLQLSAQSGNTTIAVNRYNPDGTLDPTFGDGGRVRLGNSTNAGAVAIQPDGRILVGGTSLYRLLPDGSLDPSFSFGAFGHFVDAIEVAADGDIIVGGRGATMVLGRFNSNGTFDTSFGTGGKVVTDVAANDGGIRDMTLQPDGKILVVPYVYDPTVSFLMMRFNADGSADTSFDGDGRATVDFGYGIAVATSLALAPGGSILVAGSSPALPSSPQPGGYDAVVARLTSAGALDTTFADGGRLRTVPAGPFNSSQPLQGMVLPIVRALPDGRFLLGGSHELYSNRWQYLVDRYHSDGTADTSFAPGGRFAVDLGGTGIWAYLRDMVVQPDGAPVLYGGAGTGHNPSEALVRLTPPGLSVRVVDAAAPEVSTASPPTTPEGATFTLNLFATDPDDDGITEWVINWGDGAAQVVAGDQPYVTHVYADGPKSLMIKASAIDGDRSISTAFANVSVTNVAPTIAVIGGNSVAEGSPYTIQFSATDPGQDTRTGWTIDWGDGAIQAYAANATSAQHTYTDDGTYAVVVNSNDEDGTFAAAPVNASITNVAPTLDPIGDRLAAAASSFRLTFTARDVVPEVFSGTIDWGDGSAPTPFTGSMPLAVNDFAIDHTYGARGTYTVTVNLSDGDGGSAQRTASVRVGDVVVGVFEGKNGNGVRDSGDPGRAGVTAFLDLDRDGALDAGEPSAATDTFGDVLFDDIPGTTHAARVIVPPNWHISTPAAGFVDVTPGTTSAVATFGLAQVAAASGTVFNDANANGVRDDGEGPLSLSVRARRLDNGTSVSVITDAEGFYRFTGLLPGQYLVELTRTSGVITTPYARRGHLVTVTGAETEFAGLHIGTFSGTGGAISGSLYRDLNGNGTRDSDELGVSGQTVYIDVNNNGVRDPDELSSLSGFTGGWSITRLPAGTYRVRQVLPPGSPNAADPVASREVTVALGQHVTSIDLARPFEKTYYVRRSGDFVVVYNGSDSGQSFLSSTPASSTTLFTVSTSGADDWVIIDWTFGNPVPAGGLHVDGLGGGGDTVSVIGTSAADAATFSAGNMTISGASVSHAGVERVTFDGRGGWDDVTITGGPALTFADAQRLQSLTIASGTVAVLPANGSHHLLTRGLSIDGTLDLTDNDLLVDYTGASPYANVKGYVVTGRNTGSGGIVSTFGAGDVVLAVVDNALFGRSSWNGIPIDSTTIIGKYTYFGDANLDGMVSGDDYLAIDANLGIGPGTRQWFHGDFNFDGNVTGDDYLAIDAHLGKGTSSPLAFADDRDAMIEIHAARFGGESYVKAVEQAAKGNYKIGGRKLVRKTR